MTCCAFATFVLRSISVRFAIAALLCLTAADALSAQFSRGVTLAGPEFTESTFPGIEGVHYSFNSESSFAYFAQRRLNLIRVPIRWERIQPEPYGPLDPAYLAALGRNIEWSRKHGAKVIIDLHNYGRFKSTDRGILRTFIIDNSYGGEIVVSREALADLWLKLSSVFRTVDTVFAYGLMNEPHEMGSADWKSISQTIVDALRAAGDDKLLMIAGDSWSSAERWEQTHGPAAWIEDPADQHAYEAHIYFDRDASGRYAESFDAELQSDPDLLNIGARRLAPFRRWCERNQARCYLGEFGVPGDDERWLEALDRFLDELDETKMDATYWAAGEMWGDYALSVQPSESPDQPEPPQLAVLMRHLGVEHLAVVSAASFLPGSASPGSLVSAFGFELASGLLAADAGPLPTRLGDTQVWLTDTLGRQEPAPLFFVAPNQTNFLLPQGLAFGTLTVAVQRAERVAATGRIQVQAWAPALFSANGNGAGAPAGLLIRVSAAGEQRVELLAALDPELGAFQPVPIRFTQGERLFATLFGTGFSKVEFEDAEVLVGDHSIDPLFVGPQPKFPGLDQVNVEFPQELKGAGGVDINLRIAQRQSNSLRIRFE